MSVELDLLLVSEPVIGKYADSGGLHNVWNSRYILRHTRGVSQEEALEASRNAMTRIFRPEDFETHWPFIERLIRDGELPLRQLQIGTEWQRLEQFFKSEPDPSTRELLLAAFHGDEPTSIGSTYGHCTLVRSELAEKIATALKGVNIRRLASLPNADEPDSEPAKLDATTRQALAAALGLSEPIHVELTREATQASSRVFQKRKGSSPESFDFETLDRLSGFYTEAAKVGGTVICGSV